jgi:hypothetical protein
MSSTTQSLTLQSSPSVLRKVLLLDAITCVAMGLLLIAAAAELARMLGLPEGFLWWAGVALLPCAALMGFTSRVGAQTKPPGWLVWLVILGNLAWVVASLLTVAVWFTPTALGAAFVLGQAIAVMALAAMEYRGLRG